MAENMMSIREAAPLLGLSEESLRIGLQRGKFAFGQAFKISGRFRYLIYRKRFEEITGIKTKGDETDVSDPS